MRKKCFGTGESFVFTFHTGDDVQVYPATGNNSMYQYHDKQCLAVGGDQHSGRFALYLDDTFRKGMSSKTKCYNSEVLSHAPDFLCQDLEVWAFK